MAGGDDRGGRPPGPPSFSAPGWGFGQYGPGPAFVDYGEAGGGWPAGLDRSSGLGPGFRQVDGGGDYYHQGEGDQEAHRYPAYDDRGVPARLGGRPGSYAEVGKPPRGYQRSDTRIFEDVCEAILLTGIDAGDVDVTVAGGEVTLTGTVETGGERRRL